MLYLKSLFRIFTTRWIISTLIWVQNFVKYKSGKWIRVTEGEEEMTTNIFSWLCSYRWSGNMIFISHGKSRNVVLPSECCTCVLICCEYNFMFKGMLLCCVWCVLCGGPRFVWVMVVNCFCSFIVECATSFVAFGRQWVSTSHRAVTPCGWRVKAGVVRVWVAGKTVWSLC